MPCVCHVHQHYQSHTVNSLVAAGVEQLPAVTPYALEALAAPSHSLRRLGCQQLGAALPVSWPVFTDCCHLGAQT